MNMYIINKIIFNRFTRKYVHNCRFTLLSAFQRSFTYENVHDFSNVIVPETLLYTYQRYHCSIYVHHWRFSFFTHLMSYDSCPRTFTICIIHICMTMNDCNN